MSDDLSKYYPIPDVDEWTKRNGGLLQDGQLERKIVSGLVAYHDSDRDISELRKNYDVLKPKLPYISFGNSFTRLVLEYWEKHNEAPSTKFIQKYELEMEGDVDGLAFLKQVREEVLGTPTTKGVGIPVFYIMNGLVEKAVEETTKNYIHQVVQSSWQIAAGSLDFKVRGEKHQLSGPIDWVNYLTVAFSKMPYPMKRATANNYIDSADLNYIACPQYSIGDTVLLAGPSEVGKTMTVLDSMTKLTPGTLIYNRMGVKQEYHAWLFTELSAPSIKVRLKGIGLNLDPNKTKIYNLPDLDVNKKNWKAFFTREIYHTVIPKIVYIDNISAFSMSDVNKDDQVSDMHVFLRRLAIASNSCIVTFCHTRKRSNNRKEWGDKNMEDIAGSRLLFSLADSVVVYDEVTDENKCKVKGWGSIFFCKRNNIDRVYYNIDEVLGKIEYYDELPPGLAAAVSEDDMSATNRIILQTIEESDVPLTSKEIVDKTEFSKITVCRGIKILKELNKIEQHGRDNSPIIKYAKIKPPEITEDGFKEFGL